MPDEKPRMFITVRLPDGPNRIVSVRLVGNHALVSQLISGLTDVLEGRRDAVNIGWNCAPEDGAGLAMSVRLLPVAPVTVVPGSPPPAGSPPPQGGSLN